MAGRPTHNKRYILNSIFMAISVIVMCYMIVLSQTTNHKLLKSIYIFVAVFLLVFLLYIAYSIAYRMIFVDSFTLGKNATWVMTKCHPLAAKKKLGAYTSLFTNIKEFKYFNQRFGTPVADRILQLYSKQISLFVKQAKGFCGRLGGDNFFIVIPNEQFEFVIQYLKNTPIEITVDEQLYKLRIKARAGIYRFNADTDFKNLIFYSNIAFGYAKENFLDFVEFEPSMLTEYVREKKFVADIQRALKEDEYIPYYQPKVNVKTNTISGAEALVRWRRKGELIPPTEFVHALEKAGVIDEIDFRVFEKVCSDIRKWIDSGIEPVRISTNFSKLNLKNPDFIHRIIEIKDKYNIDGKYLEVELTESAGVTNFDVIQQFAQEIKAAGMSVAIDDFGTGYSSLSMLQTVLADVVKMDKSFLDNCFKDEGDGKQFIVDVITIVRHQNSEVLFEGVETLEQLEFLREYDCDTIQGFYFDEPLPHDVFQKRLLNPKY